MTLLGSPRSSRLSVGLLLCITVAASTYVGIRVIRAEQADFENVEAAARLALAQASAASLERSVETSRAVLAILATEIGHEDLVRPDHSPLEAKLRGALRQGRFATVASLSPSGNILVSVSDESADTTPSSRNTASLRLHQRIEEPDGRVIGEVTATVPLDTRVEYLMHPSVLGEVSLTSLDGTALVDAEGSAADAILDVSERDAFQGMPTEAGVTSSAPAHGNPIAFAIVRGLPIMVTVTGMSAGGQPYLTTMLFANGVLLALGWLGMAYCMRRTP